MIAPLEKVSWRHVRIDWILAGRFLSESRVCVVSVGSAVQLGAHTLNVERQTMTNIQCPQPRVFRVSATHEPVRCPFKCFQTLYTLRIAAVYTVNVSSHVHVPRSRIGRRTGRTRCVTHPSRFNLSPLISQRCIADDRPNHPVPTFNQPLQGESNFGDSSGPLFSIYSKAAEDEDNKVVERWQKDADGILIFVSPRFGMCLFLHITGML